MSDTDSDHSFYEPEWYPSDDIILATAMWVTMHLTEEERIDAVLQYFPHRAHARVIHEYHLVVNNLEALAAAPPPEPLDGDVQAAPPPEPLGGGVQMDYLLPQPPPQPLAGGVQMDYLLPQPPPAGAAGVEFQLMNMDYLLPQPPPGAGGGVADPPPQPLAGGVQMDYLLPQPPPAGAAGVEFQLMNMDYWLPLPPPAGAAGVEFELMNMDYLLPQPPPAGAAGVEFEVMDMDYLVPLPPPAQPQQEGPHLDDQVLGFLFPEGVEFEDPPPGGVAGPGVEMDYLLPQPPPGGAAGDDR